MLCTTQCSSLVIHGLTCAHLQICKQLRKGSPLPATKPCSDVPLSVSTFVSSVMHPSQTWNFSYCESNWHSQLKYFMCFISLSPRNNSDNNLKESSHVFKSFIAIANLQVISQEVYPHIYSLKIYLNIILPSTPGSSKWSFSLRFPHKNSVYAFSLPHMGCMPHPSHPSRFDHPNNVGWGVEIIKLLIM